MGNPERRYTPGPHGPAQCIGRWLALLANPESCLDALARFGAGFCPESIDPLDRPVDVFPDNARAATPGVSAAMPTRPH